ncbi:hypothetical protein ARMSODRAFT_352435 [Armillaria solidipes]|uniref:Uncharacterized protein n=1 Tax=Armillaria solidipes TaxID=1076256 RepID=A0A2H3BRZ3_9AGAR|nr:hypothetical protein ARMSODRAFT_352435 [Armillaria solidipes]
MEHSTMGSCLSISSLSYARAYHLGTLQAAHSWKGIRRSWINDTKTRVKAVNLDLDDCESAMQIVILMRMMVHRRRLRQILSAKPFN